MRSIRSIVSPCQIREVLVERGGYKSADVAPRIDQSFRIVGLDPGRSTTIRTSFPAACASVSGSRSPSRCGPSF